LALVLVSVAAVSAGAQSETDMVGDSEESRYVVYDEEAFNAAADQTRVHFFHAAWCPTCRTLDREINANLNRIPEGVVLFKTDYDASGELKRRYGVTYQHTLAVVDAEGELVHKWTGGNFDRLLEELEGI
jgi:hypothetical protein